MSLIRKTTCTRRAVDPALLSAEFNRVITSSDEQVREKAQLRLICCVPQICITLIELRWRLRVLTERYNNLQAATQATLAAVKEKEPNPGWYLQDELSAPPLEWFSCEGACGHVAHQTGWGQHP